MSDNGILHDLKTATDAVDLERLAHIADEPDIPMNLYITPNRMIETEDEQIELRRPSLFKNLTDHTNS